KRLEIRPANIWSNPEFAPSDDHPAVFVTRGDAEAFCRWLSEREGRQYRLPRAPEWEFACRAGTTTPWYWGDDERAGDEFEWHADNSMGTTHPVGLMKPNPFGLYDMLGNVQEVTAGTGPNASMRGGLATLPIWLCRSASGGILSATPGRYRQ